jgi:hypothetical protein
MKDKKNILKHVAVTLTGLILVALGLLWFLQGIAILNQCPVLCFADCECITGGSLFWEVVGAITLIIGIAIVYLSLYHVRGKFCEHDVKLKS